MLPVFYEGKMLKYLFTVTYKDGRIYQQNPEDKSVKDPEKSCFYDVDLENVWLFELIGDGKRFTVNLSTGEFTVASSHFKMHEEDNLTNFRLIFYRSHTHSFNSQMTQISHDIVYRMGWQALDSNNRNIQRVMEIR